MKKHVIPSILLIAYSALLVKILVFKDLPIIKIGHMIFKMGGVTEGQANLIPFKTILLYLNHGGLIIGGINILGNIILLVPFGFLLPFVFQKLSWKKILIVATVVPLIIEVLQTVLHRGIFDIDDVILNGLGVMIGYGIYHMFNPGSK